MLRNLILPPVVATLLRRFTNEHWMTAEDGNGKGKAKGKGKRRSSGRPRAKQSAGAVATSDEPAPSTEHITATAAEQRVPPKPSRADIDRLLAGEHSEPHSILGAHPAMVDGERGVIVRALVANALRAECLIDDGRTIQ